MRMTLIVSIMHKLTETSSYFSEIYDTTGRVGLTLLQKCTADVCQLAYGIAAYMIDEYLKLEKLTVLECLEYYCSSIIACFWDKFLCHPTIANTKGLLAKTVERGFFGMLWSIDCMY
jgi:hypothetical protein